ncbi:MAG: glycosyltransferase family 1 protein [Kiritimatiellae bacterium]|nr:glycosyltransferase family 1 protein [Kiritimatiellia bacterium]
MYRHGGVSRYYTEMIKRLPDQLPVELFMGLHMNRYGLEHERSRMARFRGWPRPDVRFTHRLALLASNLLFEGFARNTAADIYHATSYTTHLRRFRGRRVYTFYDMTAQQLPQFFPHRQSDLRAKRQSAAAAAGLICISEATRRDVIEILGVPEALTEVIHLANSLTVSPDALNPEPEPYVLFVGMRQTYKNFTTVLEAWAESAMLRRSCRLVCFGQPPTPAEQERIAASGLTDRVRFVSGDDARLATYYAHATVFVYPSRAEGFGIPLLEAMHYGCPVVASRIPCFEEVVGDAVAYFNPLNASELAVVLCDLLANSRQREALARAGRFCEQRYSWGRVANETIAYYQRVMS